jgi:acyl-coenzyme A synthetase/AMP-(fatty) acid ligase
VRIIQISDTPIAHWSEELVRGEGEIGEIAVCGDIVTPGYFARPRENIDSKIQDGRRQWHRMGDLGWLDNKGRIWFCGRKSHRVVTSEKTLFTIPCEAIFNNHPAVFRSALVGVGAAPHQRPAICIELESGYKKSDLAALTEELVQMAQENVLTESLDTFLFHPGFPVDIRHNSKIFREKLAVWAERRIKR